MPWKTIANSQRKTKEWRDRDINIYKLPNENRRHGDCEECQHNTCRFACPSVPRPKSLELNGNCSAKNAISEIRQDGKSKTDVVLPQRVANPTAHLGRWPMDL
jgi:hypothetical protein